MLTDKTKGMLVNKALHYFNVEGWNCAESVYMAIFLDYYGMNVTPKTVSAYGGGIARTGSICGAVNVGVMAISQRFGRESVRQHPSHTQRPVLAFLKQIVSEFGAINCSQITKCQLSKLEGIREFRNGNVKENVCTPLLRKVVETFLYVVEE